VLLVGLATRLVKTVTAGATRSRVRVVVAMAAELGPVVPAASVTALAASRGWSVPVVEQVVTVIVKELPDEALGVNVQPVAVPALDR